jgi:sucrose-phosphate synthase
LEQVVSLQGKSRPVDWERPPPRAVHFRDRALFTDLDQNLVGNPAALQSFSEVMRRNRKCVTFGIATGRRIDTALAIIKKYRIPTPDVLISSLGTRIHYGQSLTEDNHWADHIDHHWNPLRVRRVIEELPGITQQPKHDQSRFKLSYYYDAQVAPGYEEIVTQIRQNDLTANVIISFGQFLDIIPSRASKGQALRYVAQRLDIPLGHILVAGGSGADEDMMRGNTLAVVVGNRHHEELSRLTDQDSIYFASQPYAMGILEAIDHYDFFNTCEIPAA